jgi:hypothetical protein
VMTTWPTPSSGIPWKDSRERRVLAATAGSEASRRWRWPTGGAATWPSRVSSACAHPAAWHTMERQPGTPLARGYRRQRSEPQAAVATRGCCDLAIPREQCLRSPGCMAYHGKTAGNAAGSRLPQAAKRAAGGGGHPGVLRPGHPA